MTAFERRLERLAAGMLRPPRKMTFVYEDGERVKVVGFLAGAAQNTKRGGLVDVLGAPDGLKNFFLCSQGSIEELFSEEGAENEAVGHSEGICPEAPADRPAVLGEPQDGGM